MGLHEATNQLKQMAIIRGVFRLLAGSGSSAYTPVLFLHALLLGLPFRCSTWKPAGTMYSWIKGTEESNTSQSIKVLFIFFKFYDNSCQGSFTNYVYKSRQVGSPNLLTFCQIFPVENVNRVFQYMNELWIYCYLCTLLVVGMKYSNF